MRLPEPGDLTDKLPANELAEAQAALREPLPPTEGYVVSITKRSLHRKLHAVVACQLKLGVLHKEWHWHGDMPPPATFFDSVCRRSLPAGAEILEEPDDGTASASGSSSSSDGEEEPAPKRAKSSHGSEGSD